MQSLQLEKPKNVIINLEPAHAEAIAASHPEGRLPFADAVTHAVDAVNEKFGSYVETIDDAWVLPSYVRPEFEAALRRTLAELVDLTRSRVQAAVQSVPLHNGTYVSLRIDNSHLTLTQLSELVAGHERASHSADAGYASVILGSDGVCVRGTGISVEQHSRSLHAMLWDPNPAGAHRAS